MALGRPAWKEARNTIQRLLSEDEPTLQNNYSLRKKALVPMSEVKLELPAVIGDYSDFFSSKDHVMTCGTIYRGEDYRIPPNWLYLPIAYHGRSSSIVVSGTDIIRPWGQTGPPNSTSPPEFKPSNRVDFELEMAMFVGPGNDLGTRVSIHDAADHIFGLVLMNDWSARDIQKWESSPLGPFLGKSFGTTISPWIVTLEALEPFICEAPVQDPAPPPYLEELGRKTYDIPLQVSIFPEGAKAASVVCQSNFKYLYWTLSQQLAHHTVNGCNLKPGDLLASGTISGPILGSNGSMLELSWNGQKDLKLANGDSRKFLEDNDDVIITASCQGDGFVVGFGTCSGKVFPARYGKAL
ncbi:hypothetical protein O6H91_11G091700 [Diphasiastrum complanatum]|nr:hypothetical protein O6H91_11G091700 [Diphasiastrum complanatum]